MKYITAAAAVFAIIVLAFAGLCMVMGWNVLEMALEAELE